MKWKTVAILFIIISILEGATLYYVFSEGTKIIENENECSINICSEQSVYYYDVVESMCYCFEGEDIVKEVYIKWMKNIQNKH